MGTVAAHTLHNVSHYHPIDNAGPTALPTRLGRSSACPTITCRYIKPSRHNSAPIANRALIRRHIYHLNFSSLLSKRVSIVLFLFVGGILKMDSPAVVIPHLLVLYAPQDDVRPP